MSASWSRTARTRQAIPDEVLLVRHGETEWSLSGQHTGVTDIPLTENGRRQAEGLGRRLAGGTFALVLSSPLGRALETCRLAGLGDAVQVRDDLREWEYGDYEGVTTAEIQRSRPGWYLFSDGCPGGEDASEVGARVDRVIAEVRSVDGDVALFGHGHCLRVLAARWLELSASDGGRFVLSTATLSVLGWEHDRPAMRLWNRSVGC
ncbi:MAG: histidine phosphatase family protein [Actinomycetota bacterium]|nr:histidine phosphatase family protein [Actinomycetota bacterium]